MDEVKLINKEMIEIGTEKFVTFLSEDKIQTRIAELGKEISEDYAGRLIVGKVDVDSNPGITSKYCVRNIPTILFFKNGQVADKQVGAVPKQVLAGKIDILLK